MSRTSPFTAAEATTLIKDVLGDEFNEWRKSGFTACLLIAAQRVGAPVSKKDSVGDILGLIKLAQEGVSK